jgi:8-oxo-dGTP pyrophosphatase MutT (NUDIX family)
VLLVVVAVALLNAKGQVLLAKRRDEQRYAGQWEFPGGKVRTPVIICCAFLMKRSAL